MKKSEINRRFIDAVDVILRDNNVSKSAIAGQLGITPQKFSEILGERMNAGTDMMAKLCSNYEISADWLLTGEGDMRKGISETLNEPKKEVIFDRNVGQPYYNVDFVGGFGEIFNSDTRLPECNIVVQGFEKASLWCNITGHSMEPKICHGDIIALRECTVSDVQFGEIYAVVLDTIRTVKIIRKGSSPTMLRFVPINITQFDEQEYDIRRILHIYEVVGAISKFF